MKDTKATIQILHARTIGSFFLLVFLAYGFGRQFFEGETVVEKYIGCMLIITNSILVLLIGFLLRKSIRNCSELIGNIYLLTRIFEAIALASIVLNLIPTISISYQHPYFIAMLVLGLGSIPMCLTFYRHKILPTWLALWGAIGYAIFAFGFFMELVGKEWSMYFLIVAGLWEITFGLWLIIQKRNK